MNKSLEPTDAFDPQRFTAIYQAVRLADAKKQIPARIVALGTVSRCSCCKAEILFSADALAQLIERLAARHQESQIVLVCPVCFREALARAGRSAEELGITTFRDPKVAAALREHLHSN